jgi:phage terminase small subunit
MAERDINIKLQKFVKAYLETNNGTKAAIAAGYSVKTAGAAASRLLKNVKVKEMMAAPIAKAAAETEVTVARLVKELSRIAFLDIRKLFDSNGHLLPLDQLDDDTAAALAGVDIDDLYEGFGQDREKVGVTKKVRTASKLDAIGKLLAHLGAAELGKNERVFNLTINLGEPGQKSAGDDAKVINHEALPTVRL